MYGILYIPNVGPLAGTSCALWYDYGTPWYAADYSTAARLLNESLYRYLRQYEGEVAGLRKVQQATVEMVEVFSGRRAIRQSCRPVVNERRPTYQQVANLLQLAVAPADSIP